MANLRIGLALAATLSLIVPLAAVAQQSPPAAPQKAKEQPKPKPKAKRVWGDEDVKELRKPWDQVEEEKKEEGKPGAAAAKPAGAEAAKPADSAENDPNIPKSVEEADKMLSAKHNEIREQQEVVVGLQRELYDEANESNRNDLKLKIEEARRLLQEAQDDYKQYHAIREELQAKKDGKASGEAKLPAPQTPPPIPPQ